MPRLDAERIALWRHLCTSTATLQRRMDRQLTDEHNLPLAWFECLGVVRNAGGSIRVSALCDALAEVPSSLSRRLDRMEEEGLVQRRPAPQPADKRAVTVSLTKHGRNEWRDANITFRRLVQQHFAQRLTETDVAALQRVYTKIT
jgi:DNA-binding MarR family transcriptional regulator